MNQFSGVMESWALPSWKAGCWNNWKAPEPPTTILKGITCLLVENVVGESEQLWFINCWCDCFSGLLSFRCLHIGEWMPVRREFKWHSREQQANAPSLQQSGLNPLFTSAWQAKHALVKRSTMELHGIILPSCCRGLGRLRALASCSPDCYVNLGMEAGAGKRGIKAALLPVLIGSLWNERWFLVLIFETFSPSPAHWMICVKNAFHKQPPV